MGLSRRELLGLGVCAPGLLRAQGIASRGVKPQPRGKPSGLPFESRLTDVARQAGLVKPVIYGGLSRKDYIVETIGCGCAFFDYDNDGWIDILVLSGTRVEGAPQGASNRLYRNNRDGTFTDVTARAGLLRTGWASSVCVGDYNNDGFEDLFLTYWGQNALYRNNGDGTFTDVTRAAGLLDPGPQARWGAGCSFVDYDRDGRLDLFVSNYLEFDFRTAPKPGSNTNCAWKGVEVNCGPRGLPPGRHSLYHNNGDGTFTDVTARAGLAKALGYEMTVVTADFDDDGWPDIFVACDSTPSLLFHNNHDGTFTEQALERGLAVNEDGMEQAGMGVATGDFDVDGDVDLLKTHFCDDTNGLYHNRGKGVYEDVTIRSGLAVETRFVGWGAGMVDLDNNGLPDIFYATGNVYPEVESRLPGYPYKTPSVVFRNLGNGRFEELIEEAGAGVAAPHSSRGCAFGDFDNDGDMDILVVNLNEPPSLLRNDTGRTNHWVKVKLVGTKSNRSAIGARAIVSYGGRRQAQEVLSQSSFYSSNDPRLHFGLGANRVCDIEVRWPGGLVERVAGVAVDQLVTIREGSGIVARGFGPAPK